MFLQRMLAVTRDDSRVCYSIPHGVLLRNGEEKAIRAGVVAQLMLSGKGDWLYFHWKAILLPARIAEYMVVHEITHPHEPYHTPAFWRRLERAMPDYVQRKAWLAEHGLQVEGIGVPVFTAAILNRICAISPSFDPQ